MKPYEYRMLCGLVFHSDTPSIADQKGDHIFPCRRCNDWHKYRNDQIPGLRRAVASARDMAHVTRLDKAILKDRIVRDLREQDDSYNEIAKRHGVSEDTVYRVAVELGLSDSAVLYSNLESP